MYINDGKTELTRGQSMKGSITTLRDWLFKKNGAIQHVNVTLKSVSSNGIIKEQVVAELLRKRTSESKCKIYRLKPLGADLKAQNIIHSAKFFKYNFNKL